MKKLDLNAKIEINNSEYYAIINTDKNLLVLKGENYKYQLKKQNEIFESSGIF